MTRNCDVCGRPYEAQRSTSRYCGSTCRVRKSKGADVVPLAAPVDDSNRGPVEAATRQELEDAGTLQTSLGQTCITLARRLDRPGLDTGSALATVAARLDDLRSKATRGANASSPGQLRDELAERRRRHG